MLSTDHSLTAQTVLIGEMRTALGISNTVDILAHLLSLKGEEKDKASRNIKKVEDKARLEMKPRPGAENILNFLHEKLIKRTICTRNNLVCFILYCFVSLISYISFSFLFFFFQNCTILLY